MRLLPVVLVAMMCVVEKVLRGIANEVGKSKLQLVEAADILM